MAGTRGRRSSSSVVAGARARPEELITRRRAQEPTTVGATGSGSGRRRDPGAAAAPSPSSSRGGLEQGTRAVGEVAAPSVSAHARLTELRPDLATNAGELVLRRWPFPAWLPQARHSSSSPSGGGASGAEERPGGKWMPSRRGQPPGSGSSGGGEPAGVRGLAGILPADGGASAGTAVAPTLPGAVARPPLAGPAASLLPVAEHAAAARRLPRLRTSSL
ncbi:unnamed protein product [Urochloa humidicola]